jgi:hypothetical protein
MTRAIAEARSVGKGDGPLIDTMAFMRNPGGPIPYVSATPKKSVKAKSASKTKAHKQSAAKQRPRMTGAILEAHAFGKSGGPKFDSTAFLRRLK